MNIETERLLLRPLERGDVDTLVALWIDPTFTRYMGGPRDEATVRANLEQDVLESAGAVYEQWPVVERASGRLVGHCGLLDKEIEGAVETELVYAFAPDVWGRGYATEMAAALLRHAFEQLGVPRAVCLIEPGNVASERVAEKLGMTYDREVTRPNGRVLRLFALARG